MLYNLKNIIKKDITIIARHRGAIFASMCLPFLLYGIFAVIFSGMMHREADISPMKVAVVDKEKSAMSRTLVQNFKENKSFSGMVSIETMDSDEAMERFKQGEFTGIITIPENFSRSLIYIDNYPLDVVLNEREPLKSSVLKNMMQSYGIYVSSVERSAVAFIKYLRNFDFTEAELDSINEKMSVDLTFTALGRGNIFQEMKLDNIPSSTSAEYFIMAILVLLLMYNGVNSGNYLIKDLNSGCLRRAAASPAGILTAVLGKWLSFSIFGIIEALVFILPISYFAELFKGFFLKDIIIYMSISILFLTSIFIFI
ncbi:MAG: ABC transporter permease, partial [Bacillota bacterium]|nr:ABC transporter permease [Bacillota bacterium]